MRLLAGLLFLAVTAPVCATSVADMPLATLTRSASDIAVARIERMAGRTADGDLVAKGSFRTGPGTGNIIWVSLRILRPLKGRALHEGATREVPLWSEAHEDMAELQDMFLGSKVVVFLKPSDSGLIPVFAPTPYRFGSAEPEVRQLLRAHAAGVGAPVGK